MKFDEHNMYNAEKRKKTEPFVQLQYRHAPGGGGTEDTCDHGFCRTSLRAKHVPVELEKKSDQ